MGQVRFFTSMGIQGLLKALDPIASTVHISDFANVRVGIDAYGWLHRGAFHCSTEICLGIPTNKFVSYCMNRIALLQRNNVIPVLVFDGGKLPNKVIVEEQRQSDRKRNMNKGLKHLEDGDTVAARLCFQKAADISPEIALLLIQELRKVGVEFVVAPYEADAQLAYMCQKGNINAVISEDSDLLVFGCHTVVFKLDSHGNGRRIRLCDLNKPNNEMNFVGFSFEEFRATCKPEFIHG